MKKKYHGIATFMIGLLAIGGMAGYYGSGVWRHPVERPSGLATPSGLGQIKVPSPDQVRRMVKLYDRMEQLAIPNTRNVAARSLTLFGYQADDRSKNDIAEQASDGLPERKMRLTLTVLAGVFRYCIVDGQFLAEGATTPDGEMILKIEAHRVLLASGQERRWVYLEDGRAATAASEVNSQPPERRRS